MQNRRGLTKRDVRIGVMLALPFVGLALFSIFELRQFGSYWSISRYYIKIYCLGVMAGGLALASMAVPRIIADLPDSVRLRAWAIFLIGVGYAFSGAVLQWYLLAKRNYQHPSVEPLELMTPLLTAWAILTASSVYALMLERRAQFRETEASEEVQR